MIRYALRRLLTAVPLLLGVVTVVFVLLHLAPGDPTTAYLNPNVPPDVLERLRVSLGLERPLHEQYIRWVTAFARGDFGYSYSHFRPVSAVIADHLPNTLLLSGASLLVIFVLGCAVGTFQAVRQYSAADSVLTFLALFLYSIPEFWLGLVLVLAVSARWMPDVLHLPVSGMTAVDHALMTASGKATDILRHLLLPVTALSLASAAGVSRFVRGEVLDVIEQDHVRTARAKGLSEGRVLRRHVFRNALLPVISLVGLYLPLLFGGAVVVEVVFSWPGMGRLLYDAVLARDYPLVLASSFLFGVLVIAGSLLADLLYGVADPRVRRGE